MTPKELAEWLVSPAGPMEPPFDEGAGRRNLQQIADLLNAIPEGGTAKNANRLQLTNYPHAGWQHGGVKTVINGQEIQEVVDIHLDCPVDGIPRLTLTQNMFAALDVEIYGLVSPNIMFSNLDLELIVEHLPEGKTRYYAKERKRAHHYRATEGHSESDRGPGEEDTSGRGASDSADRTDRPGEHTDRKLADDAEREE